MTEAQDKLGQLIDGLDNLYHATLIPMPAEFHLKQLQSLLPEKIQELKETYVEIVGENPWE